MLSNKATHLLLAGLLIVTGVYASASDSDAPLKTRKQQKRAEDLLQATLLAEHERNLKYDLFFPNHALTTCQTYANNPREVKEERNHCEWTCISALEQCAASVRLDAMRSGISSKDPQISYKLQRIETLRNRIAYQRTVEQSDTLFFVG